VPNERRRHALAAKVFADCEIVNVDFAPLLLELVELVGDRPPTILPSANATSGMMCGFCSSCSR
jgi:hypothetical protein